MNSKGSAKILHCVLQALQSNANRPAYRGEWRKGELGAYWRIWHQLLLDGGTIYRKSPDGQMKLVVPRSLQKEVLEHCRDLPAGGHLGIDKTFMRIRESFYWPGYPRSVKQYVASCQVYQERNAPPVNPRAGLQPVNTSRPFQLVAMDLELPRSTQGSKYCLVISDYFTRWPEVFAVPDQKAVTVARVLVDGVITRHGVPEVLHSDRGGSFENEVIRELCKLLGMKKVKTKPYHPQSDGIVERLNRTLLQMLSKAAADKPKEYNRTHTLT